MMSTPDRDAISLSRLFRFHIVADGFPGAIHDSTGRMVKDLAFFGRTARGQGEGIAVGTMDLDAQWVHENGPVLAFEYPPEH